MNASRPVSTRALLGLVALFACGLPGLAAAQQADADPILAGASEPATRTISFGGDLWLGHDRV